MSTLQTRVIHADQPDHVVDQVYPVAPSISVSTTFRQPHPDSELVSRVDDMEHHPDKANVHVYSRYTQDTRMRAEKVLDSMLGAKTLVYSSGLSAAASAIDFLLPKTIAIRKGYFGVHEIIAKYVAGRDVRVIDLDEEYPADEGTAAGSGTVRHGATLVWLETPLNPTGEARDIAHYAKRAHDAKGYLIVDATLAPPPLMDPFAHGADIVMHSASKYMGGHSDVLAGVLATQNYDWFRRLWYERSQNGTTLGSFETFLLLRSLRTMPLRVQRQSETASKIVAFLHSLTPGQTPDPSVSDSITGGKVIKQVWHSNLQPRAAFDEEVAETAKENHSFDPKSQLPNGGSPTFGVLFAKPEYATYLPHNLECMVVRNW